MRPDPHAGKVPGLGCPCARCQEPLPVIDFIDQITNQVRRDWYEGGRRIWANAVGLPVGQKGRGSSDTRALP